VIRKFTSFAVAAAVALFFSSTALARHLHGHRHVHRVKVASTVTPTIVPGNPADCTTGTAQHPGLGITGSTTLKYGSSKTGTVTAPGVVIHVTSADGITFSFTATFSAPIAGEQILAVYAKGGSQGGNLYDYRPGGVLSDSGLHPPSTGNSGSGGFATISHLLFCYGTPGASSPTQTGGGNNNNGNGGNNNNGNNGNNGNNTSATSPGGVTVTAPNTHGTSPTGTEHKTASKKKKKPKKNVLSRRARRRPGFTG
jgi:hypothetical protein